MKTASLVAFSCSGCASIPTWKRVETVGRYDSWTGFAAAVACETNDCLLNLGITWIVVTLIRWKTRTFVECPCIRRKINAYGKRRLVHGCVLLFSLSNSYYALTLAVFSPEYPKLSWNLKIDASIVVVLNFGGKGERYLFKNIKEIIHKRNASIEQDRPVLPHLREWRFAIWPWNY